MSVLKRGPDTYLGFYNFNCIHHGRLAGGQIPADIVYGASKLAQMSLGCRHI